MICWDILGRELSKGIHLKRGFVGWVYKFIIYRFCPLISTLLNLSLHPDRLRSIPFKSVCVFLVCLQPHWRRPAAAFSATDAVEESPADTQATGVSTHTALHPAWFSCWLTSLLGYPLWACWLPWIFIPSPFLLWMLASAIFIVCSCMTSNCGAITYYRWSFRRASSIRSASNKVSCSLFG